MNHGDLSRFIKQYHGLVICFTVLQASLDYGAKSFDFYLFILNYYLEF